MSLQVVAVLLVGSTTQLLERQGVCLLLLDVLIFVFLIALLDRGGCIVRCGHLRRGLDGVTAGAAQLTGKRGSTGA